VEHQLSIEATGPAMPPAAALQTIRQQLASVKQQSSTDGMSAVQHVVEATESLLSLPPATEEKAREVVETACRSMEVMTLLIHDAGRRQKGYPPAALHEAVHALMEQIERLRPTLH
jgi:hypothetical protein